MKSLRQISTTSEMEFRDVGSDIKKENINKIKSVFV